MEQSQRTIVILSAVLLAVIAATGVIFLLLPSTPSPPSPAGNNAVAGFDMSVLQNSEYVKLDQRPVLDASLPVPPPSVAGKANPFL